MENSKKMLIFHLQILMVNISVQKKSEHVLFVLTMQKICLKKIHCRKIEHMAWNKKFRKHIILTKQEHSELYGLFIDAINTDGQVNVS